MTDPSAHPELAAAIESSVSFYAVLDDILGGKDDTGVRALDMT
jgi:hypothetical protein